MFCCHSNLPQPPLVCWFFFLGCHLYTVPQCTAVYPQQVCELWVQKEQQIRVCGSTSPNVEIPFFFSAESFSFLDVYSNECWPEVTSCYARRPIHSSNTRLQKNKVHVGRGEHACDWRKGEGKKNSVMKGTNRNQAINMGIRLNVVNNPWTGFPSLFVTLECSDQKWQKCSTLSFFLSSCETFERVPVVSSPCLQPLTAYEYSLHLSS